MVRGPVLIDEQNAEGEDMPINGIPRLPSHARRARGEGREGDGSTVSRNVRGVLKGYKAAKKRLVSNTDKLPIQFSTRLGGAIGVNRRSFVDEIVLQMKQHSPLIGVETWSKVPKKKKELVVQKVLDRWELKDTVSTQNKIEKIAGERYKNWRSNLAATYRAYETDEDRLKHKPEEINMDVWKHLIYYFGTEKFKKKSETNSANRTKRKYNHGCGSKSFSQISYENRDEETNEEPDDMDLWLLTYSRNGKWADSASKELYENVCERIGEREGATGEPLSVGEKNEIFQDVATGGLGHAPGRGYIANSSNAAENVLEQLQEQKETNEKLTGLFNDLQEQYEQLKVTMAKEAAARESQMEVLQESIHQSVRAELREMFNARG